MYQESTLTPVKPAIPILTLVLCFLALLSLTALLSGVVQLASPEFALSRDGLLTVATVQNILAFICPALITARIASTQPLRWIGISGRVTPSSFGWMILLYIAAFPILNQMIAWNESITLPACMSAFEATLRMLEEAAQVVTNTIMSTNSIGGLIVNILLVGCLTGLSEELIFRGAMQRALTRCNIGPHAAIWVTALIFSLMHFQFYGFVPRLLLGAFFGYLYYWSGSIWVSATCHAINNSLVVITTWCTMRGIDMVDVDKMCVSDGFPWQALLSAVVFAIMVWVYRKNQRNSNG